MKHLVAPSLLAGDFLNLADSITFVNDSQADWLHIDVMDGKFVPNISFGQVLMPFIRKCSTKPLDVHLMIEEPTRYVDQFAKLGADVITIHIEAERHVVDLLDDVLEELDLVCLMSVNPGFGGQKFIYQTVPKVKRLKEKVIDRNLDLLIEIDGGVGPQNAEALLQAGANVLVAGSSVFKADDPKLAVERLKSINSAF